MRLLSKIAIVTGAASGFGEGIASRFASEGAKVVVADVNEKGGTRVVNAIKRSGGVATFLRVDVSDGESVAKMVEQTVRDFGGIDI